jgi:hypothetical protein
LESDTDPMRSDCWNDPPGYESNIKKKEKERDICQDSLSLFTISDKCLKSISLKQSFSFVKHDLKGMLKCIGVKICRVSKITTKSKFFTIIDIDYQVASISIEDS